jgi:uncharacterized membrane protein
VGIREGDARGLRAWLAGLALAGFLISVYLTWTYVNGAVPVCVGGSGGCETVQTSRYAEILGFPVAALGLFAYATMLLCAVLRGEKAAFSGAFVALVGVLFSAYLSYLELFVLRTIRQWCVAAYLVLGTLRLRNIESDVPETADGR